MVVLVEVVEEFVCMGNSSRQRMVVLGDVGTI